MSPGRRKNLRFVVHLPVTSTSLNAALKLARTLGRSITFLPDVDAFEAEVFEEDNQGVRHQVFCNRLQARGRRCELKAEHSGDCVQPVRQ
jgi:hypothetical protein